MATEENTTAQNPYADAEDEEGEGLTPPFQTPKGVHDILPNDHDYHTYIKKIVRHRCRQAGFKRITTPVFEFTEVFKRSVGDSQVLINSVG